MSDKGTVHVTGPVPATGPASKDADPQVLNFRDAYDKTFAATLALDASCGAGGGG